MDTSGLPDMYIQSPRAADPRAEGVHIRQTMTGHSITIATPSGKQKTAFLVIQVHNLYPQSNLTTLPIN